MRAANADKIPTKFNTEVYQSGHNEAVLKTVWVQAHGGSNPSTSAKDGSALGRTRKGLTEVVKPFSYAPLAFAVICYSFGKAK